VHECKAEIERFLNKILVKYGRRLGTGASSKRGFKEMGRMLQWSVFDGGEVEGLREKLRRANAIIQLIYSQAQGLVLLVFCGTSLTDNGRAAAEQDANIISDKLKALSELEAVAKEHLNKHIGEIQDNMARQNEVLENHTTMLKEMSSDMRVVMTAV
jgi:hypothetical protein